MNGFLDLDQPPGLYHDLKGHELKMHWINYSLDGHGIEYEASEDDEIFNPRGIDYINTGDVYNNTVIFDRTTYRYYVTTLADYLEKPRNRRRFSN